MVLTNLLLIFVGLAIVVFCADEAIKRLFHIARFFRLSEFVTSFVIAGIVAVLPEMSIGVVSAIEGTSSLGFGVILSSNVIDLTVVIGAVTLFAGKLTLDSTMKKSIRMSFLAVALPVLLFIDGEISRVDGFILVLGFVFYLLMLLGTRRDGPPVPGERQKLRSTFEFLVLLVSLAIMFAGASLVTDNSQALSMALGLPLFVVGAIVAAGTCLPELVFAIRACKKKHDGLGLGNILGNVLADSMLTIGVIALIQPIKPQFPIPAFATGVIAVISALIVSLLSRDGVLDRKDGVLLIMVSGLFVAVQVAIEAFSIV
jgi:cation:H+ antiporter